MQFILDSDYLSLVRMIIQHHFFKQNITKFLNILIVIDKVSNEVYFIEKNK